MDMADDAPAKKRKPRSKKPPEPRGLTARQVAAGAPPGPVMKLMEAVEGDGVPEPTAGGDREAAPGCSLWSRDHVAGVEEL